MGINEDIKQARFASEYQKATINVLFTASFISHRYQQFLKQFTITPPQFNLLRILRGQYPEATTINDLIDRMIDKSSNASRIVEKLVVKNLVERKVCKSDRRAMDVVITKQGLQLLSEIDKLEPEMYFGLHSITEQEAKTLNEILDKGREINPKLNTQIKSKHQ